MRVLTLLASCTILLAQAPDPAYEPLAHAYQALRVRNYDAALAGFQKAAAVAPQRASIRKDMAYTYLKVGETELARDQFEEAVALDPADTQAAMEFAFLCFETKRQAEARRIFDGIRKTGNRVAEQAFQNIDKPLAVGIERWEAAIAAGADNFSAHFELATLAEQRDELPLAATHFERAWRLLPERRSVLLDLGRVWRAMGRVEDANAALLAVSRAGETRSAEAARELLPQRYPYVPEFRRALALDPDNGDLRRELGYLLLEMGRQPEAEREFRILTETKPADLLSATQLGFLLYARGERAAAMPLFDRVLAGKDEDLANRVRAVLHVAQVLQTLGPPAALDARVMAERSINAGYIKDAVRYLETAHQEDPNDFSVILRLAWAYNILHQDSLAFHWFDLARKSPDSQVAGEAEAACRNLRPSMARFRVAAWIYPIYSTRWRDLFSYGQVKTEVRLKVAFRPYVSVRFVGDTRRTVGETAPQYLSESSFILGAGVTTGPWHGATAWAEAGTAVNYLRSSMLPDYRGGVSVARAIGRALRGEGAGAFADVDVDAVYMSRFGNDLLFYEQSRIGYTAGTGSLRGQVYWNVNATVDSSRQGWANFVEAGPGIRLSAPVLPQSMFITFNVLRGVYLIGGGTVSRPNFNDFRAGFWYAFTH